MFFLFIVTAELQLLGDKKSWNGSIYNDFSYSNFIQTLNNCFLLAYVYRQSYKITILTCITLPVQYKDFFPVKEDGKRKGILKNTRVDDRIIKKTLMTEILFVDIILFVFLHVPIRRPMRQASNIDCRSFLKRHNLQCWWNMEA